MSADAEQAGGTRAEGFELPAALLAAAEALTARAFALDPEGAAAFAPLAGRVIGIEISGLETRVTLVPSSERIQVFGSYAADPDCLITGAPLALLRLMGTEHKGAELNAGDVAITGDTGLAHDLTRALSGLDLDWEEQLSRLIGDIPAHRIATTLGAAGRWGRESARTLGDDLKEYVEEEAGLVPSRFELERFLAGVDTLRDDSERLAARLDRLELAAAGTSGREAGAVQPREGAGKP